MIPKIIHYCWFGGNELGKANRNISKPGANFAQTMRSNAGMNQRSIFQNLVLTYKKPTNKKNGPLFLTLFVCMH